MNLDEWNGGTGTQKLWLNPAVHTITADSSTIQTVNATTVNANTVNSVAGNFSGALTAALANVTESLTSSESILNRAKTTEAFSSTTKLFFYGGIYNMTADQICGGIFANRTLGEIGAIRLPNDADIDAYLVNFPAVANGVLSFVLINYDNTSRPVYKSDGTTLVYTCPPAPSTGSPYQTTLYFHRVGGVWVCWNTLANP